MAKLILASVLCIFLLIKGTEVQAAGGDACPDGTCAAMLTCEGGICKLEAGGDCSTTNSGNCKTGTTCESNVCKLDAGGDCSTTNSGNCKTGTTCDSNVCKVQAGQSCAATLATQCTAHADCTGGTCVCSATDFTPNTLTGVCEGTKDKGAPCANDNCKPGLVCDGGTCKDALTSLDEDCSASVTDKACDPTTLACQKDKCKWKIEQVCTATDQCVAGATCEGSGATKQCSCPVGVSPSSDKAQCGGAMGIAASMLLVVATFVTSRFL